MRQHLNRIYLFLKNPDSRARRFVDVIRLPRSDTYNGTQFALRASSGFSPFR
jgi:hypothetical protein